MQPVCTRRCRAKCSSTGVYAEIILHRCDVPDIAPGHRETTAAGQPGWVAVKAVYARRDGYDANRIPHNVVLEAKVLAQLDHPNIVQLVSHTFDPLSNLHRLNLPLLACTLADLLPALPDADIAVMGKSTAYQCLRGLAYIHAQGVAHRDINPRNIMFDWDGTLKLVDFSTALAPAWADTGEGEDAGRMVCQVGTGLVRPLEIALTYSAYRAPELLFSAPRYDAPATDLWGLGASLTDVFRPSTSLFDASYGDIGLAGSVFRVRGHPVHSWLGFTLLPDADKVAFDMFEPQPLSDHLPRLDISNTAGQHALEVLEGLLCLDPAKRITAEQALTMPWFRESEGEGEGEGVLLPMKYPSPSARNLGQSDCSTRTRMPDGRALMDLLRPAFDLAEDRLDEVWGRSLDDDFE